MNETKWGVYDLRDNCWIGSKAGPNEYVDKLYPRKDGRGPGVRFTGRQLANLAARICNERCKTTGRFVEKPLDDSPMRFKDEITPDRSAVEAMQRLGM
jgi:hypothetical protein